MDIEFPLVWLVVGVWPEAVPSLLAFTFHSMIFTWIIRFYFIFVCTVTMYFLFFFLHILGLCFLTSYQSLKLSIASRFLCILRVILRRVCTWML